MTNGKTAEPTESVTAAAQPTIAAARTGHENRATSTAAVAPTSSEEVAERFYKIDFRVHVSMRYHQARRAWWSNLNRLSSVAAALAGSTAIISVFGNSSLAAWLAAGSGGFAALNAAWGFPERAQEHADLYRGFSEIGARMAKERAPSEDATGAYAAEIMLLEASEPPTIQSLNVFCHNQECEARGLPIETQYELGFWNHLLKSWFTVVDHFPSKKPAQ